MVLLAGLTPAHVALLAEEGVNNIGDLLIFTFEDYTAMIPGSGLAVRRKLSSIAKYLAGGDTIDDTTTMQDRVPMTSAEFFVIQVRTKEALTLSVSIVRDENEDQIPSS